MALPNAHSWKAIREELKRCFSDQTSLGHAAAQLENMTQKPNEPLRLYIFRYSKIHQILQSEHLPQNLQQCFEKALRLEASLQLSEGVNMAQKTAVMKLM